MLQLFPREFEGTLWVWQIGGPPLRHVGIKKQAAMIPPILKLDKPAWQALSRRAPARAGDLAFQRFCTPRLSERRTANHDTLVARARKHLAPARFRQIKTCEGLVSTYVFEPERGIGKTVLLVHGWTSEASFMTAMGEALRRSGFRIVLFDMPAHGTSPGSQVNLIACARALIDVVDKLGPIDYAVAHSMGGLAVLLAAGGGRPYRRACPLDGYVLISTPNDFRDVTRDFADRIGLSAAARRQYERHLERVANRDLRELSSARYLKRIGRPALIIHSDDDDEIPMSDAIAIAEACPKVELKALSGLGHRKILFASDVTRSIVRYLRSLAQPCDANAAQPALKVPRPQTIEAARNDQRSSANL